MVSGLLQFALAEWQSHLLVKAPEVRDVRMDEQKQTRL
jgi:hypothetical protein